MQTTAATFPEVVAALDRQQQHAKPSKEVMLKKTTGNQKEGNAGRFFVQNLVT